MSRPGPGGLGPDWHIRAGLGHPKSNGACRRGNGDLWSVGFALRPSGKASGKDTACGFCEGSLRQSSCSQASHIDQQGLVLRPSSELWRMPHVMLAPVSVFRTAFLETG